MARGALAEERCMRHLEAHVASKSPDERPDHSNGAKASRSDNGNGPPPLGADTQTLADADQTQSDTEAALTMQNAKRKLFRSVRPSRTA